MVIDYEFKEHDHNGELVSYGKEHCVNCGAVNVW
jgi:hypothetical protein